MTSQLQRSNVLSGSKAPETHGTPTERAHASKITAAIEADFRMLVDTIAKQIELREGPDGQLVQSLWAAKTLAERGLYLSERLVKLVKDDEASADVVSGK